MMSYCAWAAFINTSYYFTGHKEHTMGLFRRGGVPNFLCIMFESILLKEFRLRHFYGLSLQTLYTSSSFIALKTKGTVPFCVYLF